MTRSVAIAGVLVFVSIASCTPNQEPAGVLVNDMHSQLNETRVDRVVRPESIEAIEQVIREARAEGKTVSIAGGRHAMGGQQFGTGTILLDTTRLKRILQFDPVNGTVEVQAGITWPELISELERVQTGKWPQWGIRQKQTGADRLTLGGALSANAHGRGLRFKPMIDDVESCRLVN
jgi:FAD/FMN-containing dehydrogenase